MPPTAPHSSLDADVLCSQRRRQCVLDLAGAAQATFTGYARSRAKYALYALLSVLTLGVLPLCCWWLPDLWIRLVCDPAPFCEASFVVVKVRPPCGRGQPS